MRKILIATVLILTVLRFGPGVPTAHANAGPPLRVEDGDAVFLVPVKHESIEVTSEALLYNIRSDDRESAYAVVQATYEFRNTANEAVTVLIAFVANNPDEPVSAIFDGQQVEMLKTVAMPWNVSGEPRYVGDLLRREWSNVGSWTEYGAWEPTFEEILRFAGTGERTGDIGAGYDLTLSLFELTFDAGASHTLSVSYREDAAIIYERKGYSYVSPKAEFYYFLEPARYWKGFSDLTVTVTLPKGMDFEASLEGFQREGDAYVARFKALPDKNLRLVVDLEVFSLTALVSKAAVWAVAFGLGYGILAARRRPKR